MSARRYVIVNVIALAVIAAAILLRVPERKTAPVEDAVLRAYWTPSSLMGPPANVPILGYWRLDNQIVTVAVVAAGTTFYEYTGIQDAPAVPLFGYPPLYWSVLPDEQTQ